MPAGKKYGGRTKGTPNKLSGQAAENVVAVFTRLGGTAAMAEWAKKNQTEFYRLYARLMPKQIDAQVEVNAKSLDEIDSATLAAVLDERISEGSPKPLRSEEEPQTLQ